MAHWQESPQLYLYNCALWSARVTLEPRSLGALEQCELRQKHLKEMQLVLID